MIVLTISDLHFRANNLNDARLVKKQVVELARTKKPDLIVFLGDILHHHERVHVLPFLLAYSFIQELSAIAGVMILVGNHDYINNQQFLSTQHWMQPLKTMNNVCVVDKRYTVVKGELILNFVPYVPNGRFIESLQSPTTCLWVDKGRLQAVTGGIDESFMSSAAIFAHQEIFGCALGPYKSENGDKYNPNFPQLISGHIHVRDKPQPNVYYPGATLQSSFSDTTPPSITLVDISQHCEFHVHNLCIPRNKTITVQAQEFSDLVIEDTNKLRICIHGTHDELNLIRKNKKYTELEKKNVKLVLRINVEKKPKKMMDDDFMKILSSLICDQQNNSLTELFKTLLQN